MTKHTEPQGNAIRLHAHDNVVVARSDIAAGSALHDSDVIVKEAIPAGHKVAAQTIATGQNIIKYDQVIGIATRDIAPGEHVHVQNMAFHNSDRQMQAGTNCKPVAFLASQDQAMFQGYRRANGKAATRNFIGVLSTVNCSATVARRIAAHFQHSPEMDHFLNVDGVVAICHDTGCGMQAGGEGHQLLLRVLAGYASHPNFAGVLLIGLGCEVAQVAEIANRLPDANPDSFHFMTIQDRGGTRKSIETGIAKVREMLEMANRAKREPISASELVLGLQCGGSDGYSGISANPALGAASDLLVQNGGTVLLSETPEIYGAEHLLIGRAMDQDIADRLMERIHWWENYTAKHGGEMNNNPAPGNKAGGLTTILEKALGATAKAGTTNLVDVLQYAEPVRKNGLIFMDSPGFDPVSATGQVASGANMICFTTGRGSVFGCKPTPSIKIASNSAMYERMRDDMDVNCGKIIDGEAGIMDMGAEIFAEIIAIASGKPSRSELLDIGNNEFIPWRLGAVM